MGEGALERARNGWPWEVSSLGRWSEFTQLFKALASLPPEWRGRSPLGGRPGQETPPRSWAPKESNGTSAPLAVTTSVTCPEGAQLTLACTTPLFVSTCAPEASNCASLPLRNTTSATGP